MNTKTQELTRAELEIMQILWQIEKGFVAHRAYGKSHEYYPIISRTEYTSSFMTSVVNNFFGGSIGNMVSFLSHDKGISVSEANEIIKMLKEEK